MEAATTSGVGDASGISSGMGGGTSPFGGAQDDELVGGMGASGEDSGAGGFVTVSIHAGSYRIPAEAFLGPPTRRGAGMMTSWLGFQTTWSGLPYVHAFAVESCPILEAREGRVLSTARRIRAAMTPTCQNVGGGTWTKSRSDPRVEASVECPGKNTDYAVSAAWAFEAWDGTPVLCAITAMKAPFARSFGGGINGGSGGVMNRNASETWSWCGRMEVRCGSRACARFATISSARLTRFVTSGVFAPSSTALDGQDEHHHLPSLGASMVAPTGGGSYGGTRASVFSRTGLYSPATDASSASSGSPSLHSRPRVVSHEQVVPLVRTLKRAGYVDTT